MSTVLDYDYDHDRAGPVAVPAHDAAHVPAQRVRPVVDLPSAAGGGADLPDPGPLAANLALCVVEILAGARELDQLSRWVSDPVFVHLLRRSTIAARTRQITGKPVLRPRLRVGDPVIARPQDGVVEAVVVVHQPARSRAVAIRLEAVGARWRASALTVL